jgi:hypothetical protein
MSSVRRDCWQASRSVGSLSVAVTLSYRLIGTQARDIMRQDFTGKCFSEIPGKGKESALWYCEAVVRRKAPISWTERFLRNCENALLPLSNDRVNVTMIFKVISFERGPRALATGCRRCGG